MTQELHGVISLGGTVIGGSLYQRGLKGETGATGATGNGIASISKTGSSELVDTYTITYTNGNTATFTVTNGQDGHDPIITATKSGKKTSVFLDGTEIAEIDDGVGIDSIYKTGSSGLDPVVDEYTILYDDGNYTTFTVTNGKKGDKGDPQSPYTSTPEMDGTGSAGSSSNYARGDHVHPSDTSKVDKEVGKGLSANDFTDSLKTKLEGVESGAEVNVQSDWNQSTNTADDYIKNKPDLSVYAPLDSPSLTGTPTAPTATEGTNTTQIATTAFVKTGDDAVKEMIKNTLPTDTASGSIASFEDGSDLFNYLSCVVNIEPVQAGSGTPSPQNVRPITGWTGCEVSKAGKNLTPSVRGEYIPIHIPAGTSMTASYVPNSGGGRIYYYDRNKTIIDYWEMTQVGSDGRYYRTFTTLQDAYYFQWTNDTGSQYQLEFGSTPTTYTPYTATTYPVSWQTEAGTVYGGAVDLVTGVLTVTHGYVDLGTLTWGYRTSGSIVAPYFYADVRSLGIKYLGAFGTTTYSLICYQYIATARNTNVFVDGSICADGMTDDVQEIQIKDSRYTDAQTFETAMSGVQLVYELAQAQTYQLDPVQVACLLGQNNVWADCGDIEEVKYKADVQKWVEKQLREINTAILALS